MYLVKVERVVARNRAIQSRLYKIFNLESCAANNQKVDDDDDGINDDGEGEMVECCLEEGGPLGVEAAGSSNICLANSSNLIIIIVLIWMMIDGLEMVRMSMIRRQVLQTQATLANSPP